jgi:glycosyltransferase involved in cell wall biosynthesis
MNPPNTSPDIGTTASFGMIEEVTRKGSIPTVAHLVPLVGRKSCGLGAVAVHLSSCQARMGWNPQVWCADEEDEVRWATGAHSAPADLIRSFPRVGPHFLAYVPRLEKLVSGKDGQAVSILHQHGIWPALSRVTTRWHSAHKRPTVIAAHGMLDVWALRRSRLKKRFAWLLYEGRNMRTATSLHATSEAELKSFREFGLRNPVAVIRNGVTEAWLASTGDGSRFRLQHSIPEDRRLLFFLSRITPKKGLPLLLDALAEVRRELRDWLLIIAGVDEFGHEQQLRSQADALGIAGEVRFMGPLYSQEKRDAMAACDLLVLPTYSEGSPMIVLDALGAGVPVLTTHGAPWEDLLRYECGWWVEISAAALREALLDIARMSRDELHAMGARGKDLVRSRYSWEVSARQTLMLYEWLLGRADVPDFVAMETQR